MSSWARGQWTKKDPFNRTLAVRMRNGQYKIQEKSYRYILLVQLVKEARRKK